MGFFRWVFNTQLPSSSTAGQTLFDPSKSTTFKLLEGASFEISYGDQSKAAGIVGTDVVNIGGATVNNQAVELATEVTDSFVEDANSDGLLGLGFSTINTVQPEKQKTFFDNIQASLVEPLFTVNLRHAEVGAYEFGRIDPSKFQGSLTFTPVDNSHGFWEIQSNSSAVGDDAIQSNAKASPAIADTGTSLMLVDDEVAEAYWSQVQGARFDQDQQAFIFPCDSDLPDFHVALGAEYMGTIPGELMNFSRAGGHPGSKLTTDFTFLLASPMFGILLTAIKIALAGCKPIVANPSRYMVLSCSKRSSLSSMAGKWH